MKRSLGLLTVAVVSTLTMTGCPGGSGRSEPQQQNNNNNSNYVVVNNIPNESCNISTVYPGIYQCTQSINGMTFNTTSVSFNNVQELCSRLNDYQLNLDINNRSQVVASQTRSTISGQRNCNSVTNPTNPTNPTGPVEGFKTFNCQMQVRKGNLVLQGEVQPVRISKFGGQETLRAYGQERSCNRWLGCVYLTKEIASVNVRYDAALIGSSGSMDKVTLSTQVDGSTYRISGFAGSETRIEVTPQDEFDGESTTLIVSCVSPDATVRPQGSTALYQCKGREQKRGRAIEISYPPNQMIDVINSGISITNSVFVQGSGDSVNVSLNDSTLHLKSYLNAKTSIEINKSDYRLNVDCQPK